MSKNNITELSVDNKLDDNVFTSPNLHEIITKNNDFNNINNDENNEFYNKSLIDIVKIKTSNNLNNEFGHDKNNISSERLLKIYLTNNDKFNIWSYDSNFPENDLHFPYLLKYCFILQIVTCLITIAIFSLWYFLKEFDFFLFGCMCGSIFLVLYSYCFNGDPCELVFQQTNTFLIVNIGMVFISYLFVISSAIWYNSGLNNNINLLCSQIISTLFLFYNIIIFVFKLNDKLITSSEFFIFEMWWEIKKRAQWNNYNNCLTACNERESYLDSYQFQKMFF